MQYLLLLHASEDGWSKLTKAQQEQGIAAYQAYTEALKAAGVYLGSNRLQPASTASIIRIAGDKPQVLDGPYMESKEQLGGYYMIDVPDHETALSWAARCPGASHGTIEAREIWYMAS